MKTMKTMIGMTTMKRWLLGLGALCGLQTLSAQNLDSLLRTVHDRDQAVRLEVLRLSQWVARGTLRRGERDHLAGD